MTRVKMIKYVKIVVEIIFVLFLLLVSLVYFRLIIAPISLNFVRPRLEKALTSLDEIDSLAIGNMEISFAGNTVFPRIAIHDIKIFSSDTIPIAALPESYLSLKILSLTQGEVEPYEITINNPSLFLTDSLIQKLFSGHQKDTTLTMTMAQGIENISGIVYKVFQLLPEFREFSITNFSFKAGKGKDELAFDIPEFSLTVQQADSGFISLNMIKEKIFQDTSWIEATARVENFQLHRLKKFIPTLDILENSNLTLNGDFKLNLNRQAQLEEFSFNIDVNNGSINIPSIAFKPPSLDRMVLKGAVESRFNKIELEKFLMVFGLRQFEISGITYDLLEKPGLFFKLKINRLYTSDIATFWPRSVETNTRQWIIDHIIDGEMNKLEVRYSAVSGKNDIEGNLNFSGLTVDHSPPILPPKDLNGYLEFIDGRLIATDLAGTIAKSDFLNGKVQLFNIGRDSTHIQIRGDIVGPAVDILGIVYSAGVDSFLNITEGNYKAEIILAFPLGPTPPFSEMDFSVNGDFLNVEVPDISGYELSEGNFQGDMINGLLRLDGTVIANGIPTRGLIKKQIFPAGPLELEMSAKIEVDDFHRLGIPDIPFITGESDIAAKISIGESRIFIDANVDLMNNKFSIAAMGLNKPVGVNAKAELKINIQPGGETAISDFQYKSDQAFLAGSALFYPSGDFSFALDSIIIGRNNFALEIAGSKDKAYELKANGKSLDLTNIILTDSTSKNSEDFDDNISYLIKAGFDTVYLKHDVRLYRTNIFTEFDSSGIEELFFVGNINAENRVRVELNTDDYPQKLYIDSESAGYFLRGLITDSTLFGGHMVVNADVKSDSSQNKTLTGIMRIDSLTIIGSPVFAQILSMASLDGINDSMNDEGIIFTRTLLEFQLHKKKLTISKGVVESSALGITGKGFYNFGNKFVYVKGTLIPINFLNGIFSNVPILKSLVDDGGLIALTYYVRGTPDSLKIDANPLSLLTPGTLRNVFNIFEQDADTLAKNFESSDKK